MEPRPPQGPAKIELSQEDKELAVYFEGITIISISNKILLILTWRHLKRATDFLVKNSSQEAMKEMEERLKKAGLFFKNRGPVRIFDDKLATYNEFCIASTQEDLDTLDVASSIDDKDDPRVYLKLGELYGFPQSAINVFHDIKEFEKRNNLAPLDLKAQRYQDTIALSLREKRKLIPAELRPFCHFIMSRAHWKFELEVSKKWAEEIKLVAPTLYQSVIDQSKRKK